MKLIVKPTNKPFTFYLKYTYNRSRSDINAYDDNKNYEIMATQFVKKVNEVGLNAKLRKRYKLYSHYYITFNSKHDVMAFKLGWL